MRNKKGTVALATLAEALGVNRLTLTRYVRDGKCPVATKNGTGEWQLTQAGLRKALLPELPEARMIPEGWQTVPEAAKVLGMTAANLYMCISRGLIKAELFEGVKCVRTADLEGLQEQRRIAKEARALKMRIAQLTKLHAQLTARKGGVEQQVH